VGGATPSAAGGDGRAPRRGVMFHMARPASMTALVAQAEARARRQRWENLLASQIKALQLPAPEREHAFAPGRRFRADFAWPTFRLLIEIEGLTGEGGRHQRFAGFQADAEKYRIAHDLGWLVLRFTPLQVKLGQAVRSIEIALARAAPQASR